MYTIGALFYQVAFNKKGYQGIINLLTYGNKEKDFYSAMEKELGVKQKNLNTFFRQELEKHQDGKYLGLKH